MRKSSRNQILNSHRISFCFRKLQAEVGGNVEFMVTGAAPISSEVLELCRVALGCVIVEGYGQTECSAACSLTMVGDAQAGHVGPPLPCNTIRLDDVPEMNVSLLCIPNACSLALL